MVSFVFSCGSSQVMVNCCLRAKNVTFGVPGAPGGAENTGDNAQIRHKMFMEKVTLTQW